MTTYDQPLTPKLQQLLALWQALSPAEKRQLWLRLAYEDRPEWARIPAELILWQAPPARHLLMAIPHFWPTDETADELNEFVRQQRRESRWHATNWGS